MITLEQKHIDHLYEFVRRHFVPYYDLQTELVDHLASGIEKLSEEYPGKSFEQLLDMEFRKFGVHGFEDVVAKRRNALSKEYHSIVLKRVLKFFQWPVILQSLFFMAACYLIIAWIDTAWLEGVTLVALFLTGVSGLVNLWVVKRRLEKAGGRKWLLQEVILSGAGLAGFLLYLYAHVIAFLFEFDGSLWGYFLFAVTFVVMLRTIQVIYWVIPSQIDSILEERYKTYKFSD